MRSSNDNVIWLVGDGRSGTTWVCDLINHRRKYRELFEPFHPQYVSQAKFLAPNKYARAEDVEGALLSFVQQIITGAIANERVNSNPPVPGARLDGVLIKDIFANLTIHAACKTFPAIKPILLIRNPFAVALSKYRKRNWSWVVNPLTLLNQPKLMADYLDVYEALIRRVSAQNNYILNLILIWAVINFVPLRQFHPNEIHVCFYESILENPYTEIAKILRFAADKAGIDESIFTESFYRTPSRTSGALDTPSAEENHAIAWQQHLPAKLIDAGQQILSEFGLLALYNQDGLPQPNELWRR